MADQAQKKCMKCGAGVPADAPQGLCPQCLMKIGIPTDPGKIDEKSTIANAGDTPSDSAIPSGGFEPLTPEEIAEKFPQLEILELLGQGGMGVVYKARQTQLDRQVALKVLSPQIGQSEAFTERFSREARSLAKLDHPHIVTVYDFGQTEEGLFYFIMEYVDGTDLRRLIQSGELNSLEALAIIPQVCDALQYAHDEGIVHRDIKPENILLDQKGRVKIADFGLARLLDRPPSVYTLTHAGQRMGTPHYMAPEQIEGAHEVDHRADIYSLGVVFYEMLTGELPLGRFAPPSQKVRVDVRLDEVVLRSLEKEPQKRYQQVSEVKTEVELIQQPESTHSQKLPVIAGRYKILGIAGLCITILSIILVVWGRHYFSSANHQKETVSSQLPPFATPNSSPQETAVNLSINVPKGFQEHIQLVNDYTFHTEEGGSLTEGTIKYTIDMLFECLAVDTTGAMTLKQEPQRIRIEANAPEENFKFDSQHKNNIDIPAEIKLNIMPWARTYYLKVSPDSTIVAARAINTKDFPSELQAVDDDNDGIWILMLTDENRDKVGALLPYWKGTLLRIPNIELEFGNTITGIHHNIDVGCYSDTLKKSWTLKQVYEKELDLEIVNRFIKKRRFLTENEDGDAITVEGESSFTGTIQAKINRSRGTFQHAVNVWSGNSIHWTKKKGRYSGKDYITKTLYIGKETWKTVDREPSVSAGD